MKISKFTEICINVLTLLCETEKKSNIDEINSRLNVSRNHLAKSINFLGKNGWIATKRGKSGGVIITKEGMNLEIKNLIRETNNIQESSFYSKEISNLFASAQDNFIEFFSNITIYEGSKYNSPKKNDDLDLYST